MPKIALDQMLDHHDRDAVGADARIRSIALEHLGRVQPGQQLVEQQQRRSCRQRARQLQPLAIDQREMLGQIGGALPARPTRCQQLAALGLGLPREFRTASRP